MLGQWRGGGRGEGTPAAQFARFSGIVEDVERPLDRTGVGRAKGTGAVRGRRGDLSGKGTHTPARHATCVRQGNGDLVRNRPCAKCHSVRPTPITS